MSYNPYREAAPPSTAGNFTPHQVSSKVTPPGIALIVLGALGLMLMGGYFLLTVVTFVSGAAQMEPPPEMTDPVERRAFYGGVYGVMGVMGLNALLQILIILGGIAMVRQKNHGLAFTGGVLSVVPCISSSLCVLGVPFGVWALIVLADTNVKHAFK